MYKEALNPVLISSLPFSLTLSLSGISLCVVQLIPTSRCVSRVCLQHLGVAVAKGPKNVHCPHASASGAGVCASPLNRRRFDFCAKYISTCKDTAKYAAYTDCLKSVTTMGAGTEGATGGDSFACREYVRTPFLNSGVPQTDVVVDVRVRARVWRGILFAVWH